MRVPKAMCGAECWTDHRLIITKLNLRIHPKRRPQGVKAPKRLNIGKLKSDNIRQSFVATMQERLDTVELDGQNVESAWSQLRGMVYSTALEFLGLSSRKHKDWFDENSTEILKLLEDKQRAYKAHMVDPKSVSKKDKLKSARSTVQQKLREMQDSWLRARAAEIQAYANRHDMKNFYSALKEIYGPSSSGTSPLLSADGASLITEKEKILNRWAEQFNSVLNRPSSINNEAIECLPQVPTNESLNNVPTLEETQKAGHLLSSGKAPGSDSIPDVPTHLGAGDSAPGL